jgi:hypothetical protein
MVTGPAAPGDSGGPVWDPLTRKAVGTITSVSPGGGIKCYTLPNGATWCPRKEFTPLLLPPGSEPAGYWRGSE